MQFFKPFKICIQIYITIGLTFEVSGIAMSTQNCSFHVFISDHTNNDKINPISKTKHFCGISIVQ